MSKIFLKSIKKLYAAFNPGASAFGRNWAMFPDKEYASGLIRDGLLSPKPLMVARLGANELTCMVNYLGVKRSDKYKSIRNYISGKTPPWWWNESTISQMQNGAGFFPADTEKVERFSEMMIADLSQVDILGSWLKEESFFSQDLEGAKKVMLEDLEPFFAKRPWTWALEGKRVLVVHPFAKTIKAQYARRRKLFENNLLPQFDLSVVPAVQSIAGQKTNFVDWFDALDSMKEQIAIHDFDVCILGCGAYGFPLASFVKGMGKKAVHLGGVTQLLFGIRGARWEQYLFYPYPNLFNEAWVRPSAGETPYKANTVEGACYW